MINQKLAVFIIIGCMAIGVWGDESQEAARTLLNERYNQQQQRWLHEDKDRQVKQRQKEGDLRLRWPTQADRMAVPTSTVVRIQSISIQGATVMNHRVQRQLVHAFESTAMDMQAMEQLLYTINDWYLSNGYITSRAYIEPGQSVADETLVINVEEGRIQAVVTDVGTTPVAVRLAFPFVGKVLNLRDLEQGVDQLNRLHQNQMVLDLEPATLGYGTVVRLNNLNTTAKRRSNRALVTYLFETGVPMTAFPSQVAVMSDNFLFINDQWVMTYSQGAITEKKQSSSMFSSITVPLGYWLMGYTYSQFMYQQLIPQGPRSYANAYGHTEQNGLSVMRTVARGQTSKTHIQMIVSAINQVQTLNKDILFNGTHKKTIGQLELIHQWYGWLSGAISVTQYQGLPWLDASPDLDSRRDGEPMFMFSKTMAATELTMNFLIPEVQVPMAYRFRSVHQWSRSDLWASDRMVLGGRYSIRGFDGSLSGDSGYYAQHEFRTPLPKWLTIPTALASIMVGLDHGTVVSQSELVNGVSEGSLVGGVLGVDYQVSDITVSVMVSKPLQWSTPKPPANETVYASLRLDWF